MNSKTLRLRKHNQVIDCAIDDSISVAMLKVKLQSRDKELNTLSLSDFDIYNENEKKDHRDMVSNGEFTIRMKSHPTYYEIIRQHYCSGWQSVALDCFVIILNVLFIAACSQIAFQLPLGWSQWLNMSQPVPVTFQTFAVFVLGPIYGLKISVLSTTIYWLTILTGAPFGALQKGGLTIAYGSTAGYFFGFILSTFITSLLSRRGGYDRSFRWSFVLMVIANLVIYICGIIWLPFGISFVKNIPVEKVVCGNGYGCVGNVFMWGVVPFIPGDLIKIIMALLILPIGWKFVLAVRSIDMRNSKVPLVAIV